MSVRLRVTLAFALVMALVLGGTGLFLYFRLAADLDDAIERNLEARAGVFSTGGEDTIAQVLDAVGPLVQTSEEAPSAAPHRRAGAARARRRAHARP